MNPCLLFTLSALIFIFISSSCDREFMLGHFSQSITLYHVTQKHLHRYGFTLIENCLQRVEFTAISLYKQQGSIAYATQPVQCPTGLATDTSYVNAKAMSRHASSAPKPDSLEKPRKLFLYFKEKWMATINQTDILRKKYLLFRSNVSAPVSCETPVFLVVMMATPPPSGRNAVD